MPIAVVCPGCQRALAAREALVGLPGRCPSCGAVTVVPPHSSPGAQLPTDGAELLPLGPLAQQAEALPAPPQPTAPLFLSCRDCGATLTADQGQAGQQVQCPACRALNLVPQVTVDEPATGGAAQAPSAPPASAASAALNELAAAERAAPPVLPPSAPVPAPTAPVDAAAPARGAAVQWVLLGINLTLLALNVLVPLMWLPELRRQMQAPLVVQGPAVVPHPAPPGPTSPASAPVLVAAETPTIAVVVAPPTALAPRLEPSPTPTALPDIMDVLTPPPVAPSPSADAGYLSGPRPTPTPLAAPQADDVPRVRVAWRPWWRPGRGARPPVAPPASPEPARPPGPAGVVWRTPPALPAEYRVTPTDGELDAAIKALQSAVLAALGDRVRNPQTPPKPGDRRPEWWNNMVYRGEMDMGFCALASSGYPPKDPAFQQVLKAYLELGGGEFTYGESWRMNGLAALALSNDEQVRNVFKPLLYREAVRLLRGGNSDGTYTYQLVANFSDAGQINRRWDNSNSQFGVFGMAAAAEADMEIPPEYWLKVAEHWVRDQRGDGGWGYATWLRQDSYRNMTDAGMNSLYVTLDYLFTRFGAGRYTFLEGFTYQPKALQGMRNVLKVLERGWAWYEGPGNVNPALVGLGSDLYALYGMMRLGASSGRKRLGGRNWVREVVDGAYRPGAPGADLEDNSWALMLLATSRAPVLFNKLAHGDESDWGYYFRDVAHLARWISQRTERRHAWQIVGVDDPLEDWRDAPILLIEGSRKLDLDPAQRRKLRDFLDGGGTVFLHPIHGSAEFKQSAKALLEELYRPEGYEFAAVPKDHPVYTGYARPTSRGAQAGNDLARIPLAGLSDGGRIFAFLCGGDIAGAWQLRAYATQAATYELMLNLRLYAAPAYGELPSRLREPVPRPLLLAGGTTVRGVRLKHEGHSTANPMLYAALNARLSSYGLSVAVEDQVTPSAATLAGARLIHLTGHGAFALPDEQVAALRQALQRGAFLVLDPAAGKAAFNESAARLVEQLGLESKVIDRATHPLFANLPSPLANRWLMGPDLDQAFLELRLDGRAVGLRTTADITAAACGHWVHGQPGLTPAAARQLWANLLWNLK